LWMGKTAGQLGQCPKCTKCDCEIELGVFTPRLVLLKVQ